MDITSLLAAATQMRASDLHLRCGNYPIVQVDGNLQRLNDRPRLDSPELGNLATSLLPDALRPSFARDRQAEFAVGFKGLGRFRCSLFRQRGTIGIVIRIVPTHVASIDELGLPPLLKQLALKKRGLILVTGTVGSGKRTTLAALVDHINHSRAAHIITIEDPIEFLHTDDRSIVNQREVTVDAPSFASALRSGLRQDPDVLLLGEIRDLETIETGLTAADTGHLVLATVHTANAPETINRLISVFPSHQQEQVRRQLASVLQAVISQRLIPCVQGNGRCVAVEIMVNTPFIKDCIEDPAHTNDLGGAIASGGSQYGMQTFDHAIYLLLQNGQISQETALRWASNADELELRIQGVTPMTDEVRHEMPQSPLSIRLGQ